jgi:ABC-type amino acid transport substrate-binding protein
MATAMDRFVYLNLQLTMGYKRLLPLLLFLPFLALISTHAFAVESTIVFVAPTNSSLPTAEFRGEALETGILKDFGQAIGEELHRKALFISLPRKRIDEALSKGEVDGICNFRPEWMGTSLHWSQPLIADGDLLVSSPGVPAPKTLADVAGKTLGLVLGYKYPDLDAVLGTDYQRDDAPNAPLNIQKLLLGRLSYAVVDRLDFDYQSKRHPEFRFFARLPISSYNLRCGFSLASQIPFGEIDNAVHKLVRDGNMERILKRYR